MWKSVNRLLHRSSRDDLCDEECAKLVPDCCQFFVNKLQRIQQSVQESLRATTRCVFPNCKPCVKTMSSFSEVTSDEVARLISSMPAKSSPLDVLPTSLLKSCASAFAPVIARLANLSFKEGCFPESFKTAQVLPLLKKPGLDRMDPASYRPISNLSTVSKIVERLVASRLKPQLLMSGNFCPLQSAYRAGHSTETALLGVLDGVYRACDSKQLTFLVSLDISAAFDAVNHGILLQRLVKEFGIEGIAADWLQSYLAKRCQFVKIGRHHSTTAACKTGVPQGSVLGPLLFSAYVSPIGRIISRFGINYHQYADDTQLYVAATGTSLEDDLEVLDKCAQAVRRWYLENDLLLNAAKSEAIAVGTRAQLAKVENKQTISLACANLPVGKTLKTLGVVLDSGLTFDAHVQAVCRSCNYHIWALRHIRHFLTEDIAKTLACSIVGSRLDYCNALLYGCPDASIKQLQCVQNSLARAVLRVSKRTHATPLLQSLHWLPIKERINYKLACITFKVRSTSTPGYLNELLQAPVYSSTCQLRSSSRPLLAVRRTNTVIGERGFSVAAPRLWNNLPVSVQSSDSLNIFKKRLKTFLFTRAYDC
jgi:hypothetical protein